MPTTETGAGVVRYPDVGQHYEERQYKVIDADIRLGLALMAEHVYCIDGQKNYFDLPGFRMVGLDEYRKFVGVDTDKDKQDVKKDVHQVISFITERGEANQYTKEQIAKGYKDVQYTFTFENNKYKILDNNKYFVKDFHATDEKLYYNPVCSDLLTGKLKEAKVSVTDKMLDCIAGITGTKKGNKNPTPTPTPREEYGIVNPCGFKAAIYKRTSDRYSYDQLASEEKGWDLQQVEYALVFSGTDADSVIDWVTANVNQGVGSESTYSLQYKLAELLALKIAGNLTEEQRKKEWIIVGHSLGGGLSSAASAVSGIHAITFNAAGLNVNALASYIRSLTNPTILSQSTGNRIPKPIRFGIDKIISPYTAGMGLKIIYELQNISSLLLFNRTLRDEIRKRKDDDVLAYRSTTDVLTSTQDNIWGSKNNKVRGPNVLWDLGGCLGLGVAIAGSAIACPIGTSMAVICTFFTEDGLLPNTFGKRIDVPTEYAKTYKKGEQKDYLKVANDGMGHGMQMLVDGFTNMIHHVNNHIITLQQGGMGNHEMFEDVVRRCWYIPSKDPTANSGPHIKLVYRVFCNGDESIKADSKEIQYPVYGFAEEGTLGAIVRNEEQMGDANAPWKKSGQQQGDPDTVAYKQLQSHKREPSHHAQEEGETTSKDILTQDIINDHISGYNEKTQNVIRELFQIEAYSHHIVENDVEVC